MATSFSILIVAPPGRFSDGLQAVVQSLPEVSRAVHTQAGLTTPPLLLDSALPVIILDATLPLSPQDAQIILQDVSHQFPWSKTIALVNTTAEMQAYESFTDVVLLKGFTTAVLRAALIKLLPCPASAIPAT